MICSDNANSILTQEELQSMEYLEMESLTDTPSKVVVTSATEIWMSPVEEGKALLM